MYAILRMRNADDEIYEVSDETFDEMKAGFKTAETTCFYDLLDGGLARVSWSDVRSIERHENDPNRILLGSTGDDEGRVFTRESTERW